MSCLLSSLVFLLFFLSRSTPVLSISYNESSSNLCHADDSIALLEFRKSLIVDNATLPSQFCLNFDRVSDATRSWKEGSDCCEWDGVNCDHLTGYVVGLDLSCSTLKGGIESGSSLFQLHHLRSLNLAFNDFFPSPISSEFGRFSHLKYLNLSSSGFSGIVPLEIGQLSQLISLDLSFFEVNHYYYYYDYYTDPDNSDRYDYYYYKYMESYNPRLQMPNFKNIIQNLTELRELEVNHVDINSIMPHSLMNLTSLTSLQLRGCSLQGQFPNDILQLPHLQFLGVGNNSNLYTDSIKFNWSTPLETLSFDGCNFSGQLHDSLQQPQSLRIFIIENCHFSGVLPTWLWNITEAIFINGNYFTGELPSSVNKSRLSCLTTLDLWGNLLTGPLPAWLSDLPSLKSLDLSFNRFTGQLDEFITGNLRSNFSLTNLQLLMLRSNSLTGNVELNLFSKLKNLMALDLSNNGLSVTMTSSDTIDSSLWPSLKGLGLSSCGIRDFPDFLRFQEKLEMLDLSSNKIQGDSPKWLQDMGKYTLYYLNLSHNSLTGGFVYLHAWTKLQYIDLSSNMLRGPVPYPPLSTVLFFASRNLFTGEIPLPFRNLAKMQHLDLSHNRLSGEIPQWLGDFSNELSVLDLRSNNLHGFLPTTFPRRNSLRVLDLNGNQLEGPLPPAILRCKLLAVLDLGNNKLNGTFPLWLGALEELQVLVLRSNSFHGLLSSSTGNRWFTQLRILDLSNNYFIGMLPSKLLKNFEAMKTVGVRHDRMQYMMEEIAPSAVDMYGGSYYTDSITFTVKGFDLELEKILTILTAIDVSNNKFSGDIPESIGELVSMRWLNLSHNCFTGNIPPSLGNLNVLESLDLSSNQLVGQIPRDLVNLNYLESFNVSKNQLVGLIPQGMQFNSFGNDSYLGNPGLCGFPLSNKCEEDEAPESEALTEYDPTSDDMHEWEIILIGYGSGLICGLAAGYYMFIARSPLWLLRLIQAFRN
ncbi:hypothetical protein Ancab_004494 [Ancistrocladus abbreviatus]